MIDINYKQVKKKNTSLNYFLVYYVPHSNIAHIFPVTHLVAKWIDSRHNVVSSKVKACI